MYSRIIVKMTKRYLTLRRLRMKFCFLYCWVFVRLSSLLIYLYPQELSAGHVIYRVECGVESFPLFSFLLLGIKIASFFILKFFLSSVSIIISLPVSKI